MGALEISGNRTIETPIRAPPPSENISSRIVIPPSNNNKTAGDIREPEKEGQPAEISRQDNLKNASASRASPSGISSKAPSREKFSSKVPPTKNSSESINSSRGQTNSMEPFSSTQSTRKERSSEKYPSTAPSNQLLSVFRSGNQNPPDIAPHPICIPDPVLICLMYNYDSLVKCCPNQIKHSFPSKFGSLACCY